MSAPPQPRPEREIRAVFTDATIRVYQAFSPAIAEPALAAGRFVPPFSRSRMTWIKPSFTWMMHRSGWATKEGQERVLAIDITRSGFEQALSMSCLSAFDRTVHASMEAWRDELSRCPVRVQWDPERTIRLEALPWRTIQIGLQGEAVQAYVDEWIVAISDATALAHSVHEAVRSKDSESTRRLAPIEAPYPLPTELHARLRCAE